MTTLVKAPTAADYQAIFDAERVKDYPVVNAFEARMGFALDRDRLESAARVLACPLKKSPPNWQHGRVLYAFARKFLSGKPGGCWTFLDIGSAKGFSALCMQWALMDHAGGALTSGVTSVDVIDPDERVRRNTVAEVDGLRTLRETLAPWPESQEITFKKSTGIDWINGSQYSVDFAFVDGKHTGAVVAEEGRLLADMKEDGEPQFVVFDDVHLDDVNKAVISLSDLYELETLRILPNRAYAIGVRRG